MRGRDGMLGGVVLLLLGAAGCGDEDRTQTGYTPAAEKTSTSTDDTAAVPARVVSGVADTLRDPLPPPRTVALALTPLGGATVRGSGRISSSGRGASVPVALTGGLPGTTYDGAVRQGVCARIGPQVAGLHPVSADSLGRGAAASDLPFPPDSLLRAPHVVVYGRGGRPEACAPVGPGSAAPAPDTARSPASR